MKANPIEATPVIDGEKVDVRLPPVVPDRRLPLSVRMRAAIEVLPFTHPKLAVTAMVSEQDFATVLDRRLKRIDRGEMEVHSRSEFFYPCLSCHFTCFIFVIVGFPFLFLRWLLPSLYRQRFLRVPKLVLQLTFCIRFHRSVWTKLSNACQTNENCGFTPFQQLHRPNPFLIPQVVSPLRQRLVTSALGPKVTLLSIQDFTDLWFHLQPIRNCESANHITFASTFEKAY